MPSQPPSSAEPTMVLAVVDLASIPPPAQSGTDHEPDLGLVSTFEPHKDRFRFENLLGAGGTSRVYAAFDEDLEREVAVKVVPQSGGATERAFAREARVTASLAHPNVPPVYDVGVSPQGYYLTLPRIRGRSLRALIDQAVAAGQPSALGVSELVEVFLKICDALSYAHDHGIIHQDIKPANIMIGNYGEVMLVDWGAASLIGEAHGDRPVTGTPAYIAPEQAEGATESPAFDVYALGATLFHALLLRKPLVDKDQARFWARKAAGDLDFPSRAELSRYPRALLGIARRAMSTRPSERYASIAEFAQALRDFAGGGRNWSAPLIEEHFGNEGWREHFVSWPRDAFERGPEGLRSKAEHAALLYYDERMSGGIAIEYEACMGLDGPPGDISAIWTEDDALTQEGARFPKPGSRTFCFQVGALSNHLVGIFRDFHRSLSSRSLRLEPGRTYRIRVELDERNLRLSIDGELMAEYEERDPLRSGYLALYGYFPGKSFTNVRIYQRGQPDHVSPLAIGDAFFARGNYEDAEIEYRRVELGRANDTLVTEALYKRGLCELHAGRSDKAFAIWRGLDGPGWRPRIELHTAEDSFENGHHRAVLETLERLHQSEPGFRGRIVQLWRECVARLVDEDPRPLGGYLELRERLFGDDPSSRSLTARALLALGHYAKVVADYPSERLELCDALLALGRFDVIVGEHGDMTGLRDATLVRQGRLSEVSSELRSQPRVLLAQGRYREAWQLAEHAEVAIAAGEYERALGAADAGALDRVTALIRLGRLDEAVRLGHPLALLEAGEGARALERAATLEERVRVLQALALEAFHRDDFASFEAYRVEVEALPYSLAWEDFWCERFLLLPLCAELCGRSGALRSSLRELAETRRYFWVQRAYFMARFVLGEITEAEFSSQPAQGGLRARLALAEALRAEARGDAHDASRAYSEFLGLPITERAVDSVYVNPTVERFVRERLARLHLARFD